MNASEKSSLFLFRSDLRVCWLGWLWTLLFVYRNVTSENWIYCQNWNRSVLWWPLCREGNRVCCCYCDRTFLFVATLLRHLQSAPTTVNQHLFSRVAQSIESALNWDFVIVKKENWIREDEWHRRNGYGRWFVAWVCRLADQMQCHTTRSQGQWTRFGNPCAGTDPSRRSIVVQFIEFHRCERPWHEGFQSKATNGAGMCVFVPLAGVQNKCPLPAARWSDSAIWSDAFLRATTKPPLLKFVSPALNCRYQLRVNK